MGENSAIEWTDHTWNPHVGCTKVSQGCKHCYMFREQTRYGNDPEHVRRTSDATFHKPKSWKEPARVFTCSWSDFFIEEADGWRADAWGVIRDTPHLIYQILTKRPQNIPDRLPDDWGDGWSNVWLGVSVENQRRAVERIPALLNVPAAVRFLSCEPLLGPVDLEPYMPDDDYNEWTGPVAVPGVDWVIVGGESGPGAREMRIGWAYDIIQMCEAFGVPVFLKQLGGWPDKRGGDKAVIGGRTWRQFPDVPSGQMRMF